MREPIHIPGLDGDHNEAGQLKLLDQMGDLVEGCDLTRGEVLWVLVAALACQLYSISPDLVVGLKLTDHICSKIKDSLEARFDAARDRGDV